MRILFVTETFLPKVDGIVHTLCKLLDYLNSQGHETMLAAPGQPPAMYHQSPIIRLPSLRFAPYPELYLTMPWANIGKVVDDFKPHLVHLVNPAMVPLTGIINHVRRRRIPLVASYHTDLPGFAARWGLGFLSPLMVAYLRRVHNACDLNFCPSSATLQEIRQQGFRRLKIWTRGVDTQLFNPKKRDAAWRNRLSAGNPDAPLLATVGRLSPEKRVDWLLPVLHALPQVRLAIVGDGPQRKNLQEQFAGTQTVFTGYLRGEDLSRAYAAADVFVFPAANETLGNVALEAMASGLPVVAARSGGVLDVISEGDTGLFFDPEDKTSLVAAVATLVHHPDLISQMSARAVTHVQTRRWQDVMDKLLEDYQQLVLARSVLRRMTLKKTSPVQTLNREGQQVR